MSEWLDLELSHHLAPVKAPDELWGTRLRRAARPPDRRIWRLPVAAVVTLILAGALYFIARGQPAPARYRGYTASAHTECLACHTTL